MLVTVVGLTIVLVASIFIAWPLLEGTGGDGAANESEASALVKEKEAALDAIGEIDFDHRVGKISDEDHAELRRDLEKRALEALSALDGRDDGQRTEGEQTEPAQAFCSACGARRKPGVRFCTGCGKKIPGSPPSRNRRGTSSGREP